MFVLGIKYDVYQSIYLNLEKMFEIPKFWVNNSSRFLIAFALYNWINLCEEKRF